MSEVDSKQEREIYPEDDYLIETWKEEGMYRLAIHHGSPGFEFEDVEEFLNVNFPTRRGAIANARVWWEGQQHDKGLATR